MDSVGGGGRTTRPPPPPASPLPLQNMSIYTYLYIFANVCNSIAVRKFVVTASSLVTTTDPFYSLTIAVLPNFFVLNSICCGLMRRFQ